MKPTRKRVIVDENVAQRNLRDAKRPQTRQALKAIEAAAEQQKKEPTVLLGRETRSKVVTKVNEFGGGNALYSTDLCTDVDEYLRRTEEKFSIPSDFLKDSKIDERMRQILLDWLNHVKIRFELLSETLSLTIYLLDKTLSKMPNICKKDLQLLGIACLFLASKFEEIMVPHIDDLVYVAAKTFTREDVVKMEKEILSTCSFDLGCPLSLHFLRRFRFYVTGAQLAEAHLFSRYLCEFYTFVYQLATEKPSTIAAASLYLSCVAYNRPLPGPSVLVDRLHVEPTKIIAVAKALVEPAIQFLAKTERLHSLRDQYEQHFTFSALQKSRIRRFASGK